MRKPHPLIPVSPLPPQGEVVGGEADRTRKFITVMSKIR